MVPRIKKLDIFILKQFGLLFIGTFFICQFVLMMQFLWRYVNDFIGKGLSMDVLGQFFGYMALMLVPQALPLAILLSAIITFGNLGESSELTAIKAAGISLMQTFKPLIILTTIIACVSFYFQNNVGPHANLKLSQLLISMRQTNPEFDIPEGIFYDGIPNSNIYVQKKDMKSGKLYGIMIYRMTESYEDAAIILADSGMLQTTAEKKHLLLTLWSGEWFENMQESEFGGSAAVPYRRETFIDKKILIDFDADFSLTDAASLNNDARAKSLSQIRTALDSLNFTYDSIGRVFYSEAKGYYFPQPHLNARDSIATTKRVATQPLDFDKTYDQLSPEKKQQVLSTALGTVEGAANDLSFKAMVTKDNERIVRSHEIEAINKFSLALQCLIFFFIGAPLGAIIRKGGLGIPVLVSVMVYIVFYIFDASGYRMARQGSWAIWFGKGLAPAILIPLAVFFTYKANNDSMVFNADGWRNFFTNLLGLRTSRNLQTKEVIIHDPDYVEDARRLTAISAESVDYAHRHRLVSPPNIISVFFRYQPDHEIERINGEFEAVINDLSNARDYHVIHYLNQYPVLMVKSHTRPFEKRWKNILACIIIPVGAFLYLRMWRYRLMLLRDLRVIKSVTANLTAYIGDNLMGNAPQPEQDKE